MSALLETRPKELKEQMMMRLDEKLRELEGEDGFYTTIKTE